MTLLVVPAAVDVAADVLQAAVAALAALGQPAYEMRQALLRGVPFLVGTDVERARGAAMELRAAGLEGWAVDDEALARAPRPVVGKAFRLFPEGIEITTRPPSPVVHAIRFSDIELIAPARSVQSTSVETLKVTKKVAFNPLKMVKGAKSEVDHRHEETEERFVLVLARSPDVLVRFDVAHTDMQGLAERRQTIARANWETFLGILKASATTARVDDRLEKRGSRLSSVSAGQKTTGMQSGLVKKTERSHTEDNEGAVMLAARLLCVAERLRRGL